MKISNYILFIVLLILTGCGAPKMLTTFKNNAETAASQGNYAEAVAAWQQYFNQQSIEETTGASFAAAAQSAFRAENTDLALSWFDQARYKNFADAEMYATLSKIYKSQDNLSKELTTLEYYSENFGDSSNEINSRIFEVYTEVERYDDALNVWEKLSEESKNELSNKKLFFLINKEKENAEACDLLSQDILKAEPENVEALEWMAKKYYWMAENRYQEQMDEYNKNKTTKQYRILLKELDVVTADFKKALPYFENLWKLNPGEKYASYFANIYARFGDEKKSKTYQQYLK